MSETRLGLKGSQLNRRREALREIVKCLFSRGVSHRPQRGRSAARVLERVVGANEFTTDRGLRDYAKVFGPEFSGILRRLKRKDHWLDAGSGLALAQTEFARGRPAKSLPTLTSVSKVFPSGHEFNPSVRVIRGRGFEQIAAAEIGRADLITDLVGILSYTARPDAVLRKYLDLLRMDGRLFLSMPLLASFVISEGEVLTFYEWFRKVEHLECKILSAGGGLVFRKEKEKIQVPELKLVSAFHNHLVYRLFAESDA